MAAFQKEILFTGAATALVTPFAADGGVDYEAFGRDVRFESTVYYLDDGALQLW